MQQSSPKVRFADKVQIDGHLTRTLFILHLHKPHTHASFVIRMERTSFSIAGIPYGAGQIESTNHRVIAGTGTSLFFRFHLEKRKEDRLPIFLVTWPTSYVISFAIMFVRRASRRTCRLAHNKGGTT